MQTQKTVNESLIRNARLAERKRRNNPWGEPAVTEPESTDAEILRRHRRSRSLCDIAAEIRRDWQKPYFGAVPYLDAMASLDQISDAFMYDSGASVVRYFLGNAGTWRGETARRIKTELKVMLKGV